MSKSVPKPSLLHLSVEEENLAAIPFAVLERRVGKRVGKIQIEGTKVLPDGTEVLVSWQVQGNSELGLPTEQDLDIFVALGVLTFQNNFAKTVTFTGREIAKIIGIQSVHGKFYQRLKIAMDRFIPLRFRGLTATDRHEDVKWLNVFQEASFTLDRETGRCVGSVTWTDKLIQSMNSGFFRVLDAGRYMELDGITGKHLYRFLAVAFEKTDMILMDARKLAIEHLGILNPPKYLSRLMQTLEPAFDQLIRIEILGSYHIVEAERWEIALRRHRNYVPERKMLISPDPVGTRELNQVYCAKRLERASIPEKLAQRYAEAAETKAEFYQLERSARLLEALTENGVVAHVALGLIRNALDAGAHVEEGLRALDICEIALDMCRQKKAAGQNMKNPAGLIVKIIKSPDTVLGEEMIDSARRAFRQQEQALFAQQELAEQRALVMEYEQYRDETARVLFEELPDAVRANFRREKQDLFRQQARYEKLDAKAREQEIDDLICHDIARREVPPFEKWYIRRRAQQAVLPFGPANPTVVASQLLPR
jgi:Replication initiator protein A